MASHSHPFWQILPISLENSQNLELQFAPIDFDGVHCHLLQISRNDSTNHLWIECKEICSSVLSSYLMALGTGTLWQPLLLWAVGVSLLDSACRYCMYESLVPYQQQLTWQDCNIKMAKEKKKILWPWCHYCLCIFLTLLHERLAAGFYCVGNS